MSGDEELKRKLAELAATAAEARARWRHTDRVDPEYLDGYADGTEAASLLAEEEE